MSNEVDGPWEIDHMPARKLLACVNKRDDVQCDATQCNGGGGIRTHGASRTWVEGYSVRSPECFRAEYTHNQQQCGSGGKLIHRTGMDSALSDWTTAP